MGYIKTNRKIALLLALSLGSTGSDCSPTHPTESFLSGDPPTDVCESSPLQGLTICPLDKDFPYGEDLAGTFDVWHVGTVHFYTLDGADYSMEIQGDTFNLFGIPDLAAFSSLGLRIEGTCGTDQIPTTAMVTWKLEPESSTQNDLVLIAGNLVPASLGEWNIDGSNGSSRCETVSRACDCFESCQNTSVIFEYLEDSLEVHQREESFWNGFLVRVAEAWVGNGESMCDDSRAQSHSYTISALEE